MTENEISKNIVDAALKVHRALGPGLFESVYQKVMAYELGRRGLEIKYKPRMSIQYEGLHIEDAFEADLIVNDCVIIELKSIEALAPVHKKQLTTYLRLTNLRLGLLINFQVELIRDGIVRVVNNLPEEP